MEFAPSSHWYALNVRTNRERSVSTALHQLGIQDYLPLQKGPADSRPSRQEQRPLFPGYLFCYLNLSRSPKLYQIPGLIRIVGTGKHPTHLEESEIELVRSLVEKAVSIEPCDEYHAGDEVILTRGPLVGISGVVLSPSGLRRIVLTLPLLMRSLAVTVPQEWIMPRQMQTDYRIPVVEGKKRLENQIAGPFCGDSFCAAEARKG